MKTLSLDEYQLREDPDPCQVGQVIIEPEEVAHRRIIDNKEFVRIDFHHLNMSFEYGVGKRGILCRFDRDSLKFLDRTVFKLRGYDNE